MPVQNNFNPFYSVKLKREGDIIDPDELEWEHDPINGDCSMCRKRYANWLIKYNEQELSRGINAGTKIQNKLRRDDLQD